MPPPKMIGHYEILMTIGYGGMGEVFLARDHKNEGRTVVIKRLRAAPNPDSSEDRNRMFLHEARVATLLKHSNIVRVYEVGFDEGHYFMAMEWLVGWDLLRIQQRLLELNEYMPVPIVLQLMIDACYGLAAAHDCRSESGEVIHLVHRDISPSNLFVTQSGELKIIDFGVAKSSLQLWETGVGVIKGKMSYLSPEQVRGEKLDHRSDLFSLGIVMHQLLSQEPLFGNDANDDVLDAILHTPILPPVRDTEALSQDLKMIPMRALQRDRELRYANAFEFADALQDVARQTGPLPPKEVLTQYLCQLFAGEPNAKPVDATQSGAAHVALGAGIGTALVADVPENMALVGEDEDEVDDTRIDPFPAGLEFKSKKAHAPSARRRSMVHRLRQSWVMRLGNVALLAAMVLFAVVAYRLQSNDMSLDELPELPLAAIEFPEAALDASVEKLPDLDPIEPVNTPVPEVSTTTPVVSPSANPRAERPHASRQGEKHRNRRGSAKRRASKRTASKVGKLTLEAKPWAKVYLNGKLLGTTPLVEQEVPAGRITLRLVNPYVGINREVSLVVPSGAKMRKTITLQ